MGDFMKRILAILFVIGLITTFIILNNQEKISIEEKTKYSLKKITENIKGAWKSKYKIIKDEDGNEIHAYLYFYDNKVRYTGYINAPEYEVEMLSTTNMYFGIQEWSYKYLDKKTLIHNGNIYNRIENVTIEDFENGNIYNK